MSDQILMEYEHPPVERVELVGYFDPIPRLTTVPLVDLSLSLAKRLGNYVVREREYIPTRLEADSFRQQGPSFNIRQGVPTIGTIVVSPDEQTLLGIQDNRFEVSWSRTEDQSYPRFHNLLPDFQQKLRAFMECLNVVQDTELRWVQAGIRYENHFPDDDQSAHQLLSIIDLSNFRDPEGIVLHTSQMIRDRKPVGRMFMELQTIHSLERNEAAFEERRKLRLNLTFRGKPATSDQLGVEKFFERGHEAIVTTFTSALSSHGKAKFGERERSDPNA